MNPKQSFQETEYAKQWENIVESKAFRAATEAALLKMMVDSEFSFEGARLAFQHVRMCGARDFVEVLSRIHLKPEPVPNRTDRSNLRHDV